MSEPDETDGRTKSRPGRAHGGPKLAVPTSTVPNGAVPNGARGGSEEPAAAVPPKPARAPRAPRAPSAASPSARRKPAKKKTAAKKKSKGKQKPKAVIRLRPLIVVPVLGSLALAWLFQPWSDYSPAEMVAAMNPRQRVETLRRFDEIFPHGAIAARVDATPLDRQEAPIDAIYDWQGERKLVEAFLEEANVTGLFVIENGVIVHERYRLGATADSRFTTFSLAGGVVASLIGAALSEGRIGSLDDTVETYAPQYVGTDYGQETLRHLLAQTSGIAFDESYATFGSDIGKLYAQAFVLGGDPDRLVSRLARVRPSGEAIDLASANTQVLAAVVSAVYGVPLATVVQEKIWRPFGMTSPASWSQNREGRIGAALGFCCWNATLQDIARFGEVLRRGGVWDDARLLPEGWLDAAIAPSAPYAEPGVGGDLGPWGYGLHFYVPADADGEFLLSGELGQYLWIDRTHRTVVAMTAADPDWLGRREEATAVLRQIVAMAGGE